MANPTNNETMDKQINALSLSRSILRQRYAYEYFVQVTKVRANTPADRNFLAREASPRHSLTSLETKHSRSLPSPRARLAILGEEVSAVFSTNANFSSVLPHDGAARSRGVANVRASYLRFSSLLLSGSPRKCAASRNERSLSRVPRAQVGRQLQLHSR